VSWDVLTAALGLVRIRKFGRVGIVRKKLVIGNWKMNGSLEKTRLLVEGLRDELQGLDSRPTPRWRLVLKT
jgi:hypothetical protein